MNILIIKLSAIGDVIHTLPALNAIRSAYPSAHITWLIEEAAAPLIIGHSALDRVIISRRKSWIKDLRKGQLKSVIRQATGLVQTLRDTAYDFVFDFQALLKSGVLVALSRGRRKIGFDRGMEHQETQLSVFERARCTGGHGLPRHPAQPDDAGCRGYPLPRYHVSAADS